MTMSRPLIDRFLEKLKRAKSGPVVNGLHCLEWQGGGNRGGYGRINLGCNHGNKRVLTHRLSWELVHGPPPPDKMILHSCDNGACCEVEHLRIGTAKDNSGDVPFGRHSARAKKMWASKTKEERSEVARKSNAAQTPEQRHERQVRASVKGNATLGAAGRIERARLAAAAQTPEQRTEKAYKGWETRRAG